MKKTIILLILLMLVNDASWGSDRNLIKPDSQGVWVEVINGLDEQIRTQVISSSVISHNVRDDFGYGEKWKTLEPHSFKIGLYPWRLRLILSELGMAVMLPNGQTESFHISDLEDIPNAEAHIDKNTFTPPDSVKIANFGYYENLDIYPSGIVVWIRKGE